MVKAIGVTARNYKGLQAGPGAGATAKTPTSEGTPTRLRARAHGVGGEHEPSRPGRAQRLRTGPPRLHAAPAHWADARCTWAGPGSRSAAGSRGVEASRTPAGRECGKASLAARALPGGRRFAQRMGHRDLQGKQRAGAPAGSSAPG